MAVDGNIKQVPSATIDDLDLELFVHGYLPYAIASSVLAQNTRSTEDKLKALRFLTPEGEPTVLGILVIGKDTLRLSITKVSNDLGFITYA